MLSFVVLFILLSACLILCVIAIMQNSAAIGTLDDCLLELRALRNEAVKRDAEQVEEDEREHMANKAYKLYCNDLWMSRADNDR